MAARLRTGAPCGRGRSLVSVFRLDAATVMLQWAAGGLFFLLTLTWLMARSIPNQLDGVVETLRPRNGSVTEGRILAFLSGRNIRSEGRMSG